MRNNFRKESVLKADLVGAIELFCAANFLTIETDQKEICALIGRIAEFREKSSFCNDVLNELQQLVSDCISSQIGQSEHGFVRLFEYIDCTLPLLTDTCLKINKLYQPE